MYKVFSNEGTGQNCGSAEPMEIWHLDQLNQGTLIGWKSNSSLSEICFGKTEEELDGTPSPELLALKL